MLKLETLADLQSLHSNAVVESSTLEYKASPAVDQKNKDEITKDVSAMANAEGGQIIYGMTEANHLPAGLDAGVDPKVFDGLWFEQVIQQNVSPRIEGLKILLIHLGTGNNAIVVTVPQSTTVHQVKAGLYYRRRNFRNDIMADYEIREAMNRNRNPELFVRLKFDNGDRHTLVFGEVGEAPTSQPFNLKAYIENTSAQPAFHAVVDIGIVTKITPKSAGSFKSALLANNDRNVPMNWFQWTLVSPPALPVFRELSLLMTPEPIKLSVPKCELGSQGLFDITIKISAPGFSGIQHWAILSRGPVMTLCPPGSPYAADRG